MSGRLHVLVQIVPGTVIILTALNVQLSKLLVLCGRVEAAIVDRVTNATLAIWQVSSVSDVAEQQEVNLASSDYAVCQFAKNSIFIVPRDFF